MMEMNAARRSKGHNPTKMENVLIIYVNTGAKPAYEVARFTGIEKDCLKRAAAIYSHVQYAWHWQY